MTDPDTHSDDCAPITANFAHQFAPCSCCMALAQVRVGNLNYTQPVHSGDAHDSSNGHGHLNSDAQGHWNSNGHCFQDAAP